MDFYIRESTLKPIEKLSKSVQRWTQHSDSTWRFSSTLSINLLDVMPWLPQLKSLSSCYFKLGWYCTFSLASLKLKAFDKTNWGIASSPDQSLSRMLLRSSLCRSKPLSKFNPCWPHSINPHFSLQEISLKFSATTSQLITYNSQKKMTTTFKTYGHGPCRSVHISSISSGLDSSASLSLSLSWWVRNYLEIIWDVSQFQAKWSRDLPLPWHLNCGGDIQGLIL